ncbi:MAG: hypothetical protein KF730_13075 [Sphingomonas sp.]|uniref:hypothetical protein n=1 Tax=Sphingomonas sp. TaxID=28214 RepID=UPI0025FFFD70|nr:hypothetical protein [Sphingomonas sp.]MBX3565495.1 hypothetical protein [Sphingomonas sp.]
MKLGIATLMGLAAVPVALASAPLAQEPVMLNNPNPASFQVYGLQPVPKTIADDGVEGGRALPIAVTGNGNVWAIGVNVPIIKPIKAGDKITIYFWAKLQGTGTASIASAQLQLASAPYTRIFGEGVTITPQWKLYQVSGVADAAYPRGTLNAAFHLNTGNHVAVLGAVAVLDAGA